MEMNYRDGLPFILLLVALAAVPFFISPATSRRSTDAIGVYGDHETSDAGTEIDATAMEDPNLWTQNNINGEQNELVTMQAQDVHPETEDQQGRAELSTMTISEVQEAPMIGEGAGHARAHAAALEVGSKIGILATSISFAGTIAIWSSSNYNHEKYLHDKLLLGASLVSMLSSFLSGVVLLQGWPVFHVEIFPANDPESTKKIKFVMGVALGSTAMVMSFFVPLIILRAF